MISTDKFEHPSEILQYLSCTRYKWYQIGVALELDIAKLEVIKRDNPYDTDDCFTEMLVHWLRNHPTPCWKVLAEALKKVGVFVKEETNVIQG